VLFNRRNCPLAAAEAAASLDAVSRGRNVRFIGIAVLAALVAGGCGAATSTTPAGSDEAGGGTTAAQAAAATTGPEAPPTSAAPTSQPLPTSQTTTAVPVADAADSGPDPFEVNLLLARTLNLGATLEVAKDETWAQDIGPADFVAIAQQGFTAVRIPIRFSDWAQSEPPYVLDEEIFLRVDAALEAARSNGLTAIIDLHNYEEMSQNPEAHRARLIAMWRQIANRYRDSPTDEVVYELLNEPNSALTSQLWNPILAELVDAVRGEDPRRTIIVGPTDWNDNLALSELILPDDNNLIVTFHYYSPFRFTHQGASWIAGSDAWLGTRFNPELNDAGAIIDAEFADVAQWADQQSVPVFLGEFGVLEFADPADRLAWVRWVREAADQHGFSWGYWDWASPGMGLRNNETNSWDLEAMNALMPG